MSAHQRRGITHAPRHRLCRAPRARASVGLPLAGPVRAHRAPAATAGAYQQAYGLGARRYPAREPLPGRPRGPRMEAGRPRYNSNNPQAEVSQSAEASLVAAIRDL